MQKKSLRDLTLINNTQRKGKGAQSANSCVVEESVRDVSIKSEGRSKKSRKRAKTDVSTTNRSEKSEKGKRKKAASKSVAEATKNEETQNYEEDYYDEYESDYESVYEGYEDEYESVYEGYEDDYYGYDSYENGYNSFKMDHSKGQRNVGRHSMQDYSEMPKGFKGMKKKLRRKLKGRNQKSLLLFNKNSKSLKILLTDEQVSQLESGEGKLVFELTRGKQVNRFYLDKQELILNKHGTSLIKGVSGLNREPSMDNCFTFNEDRSKRN